MKTDPGRYRAGEELRHRVLEAASRLLASQEAAQISIRQIAQEAGCSQMAMYRHFPDKQSLMSHLCSELYQRFTLQMHQRYDALPDPRARLQQALRQFILLAAEFPHHYRLTFLESSQDEPAREMRAQTSAPAIQYFRQTLRLCLPAGSPESMVEERLHLILATLHGITLMMMLHPGSYGMNPTLAVQRFDSAFAILLNATPGAQPESIPTNAGTLPDPGRNTII